MFKQEKITQKETVLNHLAKVEPCFHNSHSCAKGHHLTQITCVQLVKWDSGSCQQQLASDVV